MNNPEPVKVLFVCMGNICRSPTAHGVFRDLLRREGLDKRIAVDSAGTHSYHVGNPPDPRSQATARARGVELGDLRARRFEAGDYHAFDYVIGMDHGNIADMRAVRPDDGRAQLHLMLAFSTAFDEAEVPDPYYGDDGFERVFDMIEDASKGLLTRIRSEHGI